MTKIRSLDCRGLACPEPVINTKNALQESNKPILVIVDNQASCANVRRFAENQGARVTVEQQADEFHLTIEPGQHSIKDASPNICSTAFANNMVVYVSSEGMGRGDDQLGAILMKAFLDTLSQFKSELSHAIFVNAGAKLTIEGSPVLEQLHQLEELGTQVLVCGTCLDHFGIKDKLAVGSVSNMYAIIETLSKAGKIVRP